MHVAYSHDTTPTRPVAMPQVHRREGTRTALRWILACTVCLAAGAQAEPLRVLHWWKSNSERVATDAIAARVRAAGIGWVDEDAGDGAAAGIILRSRLLARDLPDVAQANSLTAYQWWQLGLATDLDSVAAAGNWSGRLLPAVEKLVKPDAHVVAVPLGIHRVNTMFYNRAVFARLTLAPPRNWQEFESAAVKLKRAGVVPLAQSGQPWQLAILFENIVLADAGADVHNRVFGGTDPSAFTGPQMAAALRHFRSLKKWMGQPLAEQDWSAVTSQLADGSAAMMIVGDWAKGEMNIRGSATGQVFGCTSAPGTAGMHLYDLDTLAMLDTARPLRAAQEKVAALAMTPAVQEAYNRAKGSVPVLRKANLAAMDSCARDSWTLFARPGAVLVPSISIGMAGGEALRDVMANELHRFLMDDTISVHDTQRRLASLSRAFTNSRLP